MTQSSHAYRRDFRAAFRGQRREWSTPELLNALLGVYLGHGGRDAIWTTTAVAGLGAFAVDPLAARQAINRANRAGIIAGERVGRLVRWRWTDTAVSAFKVARQRDERERGVLDDWSGTWSLLAFRSPRAAGRMPVDRRPDVRLRMLGYGSLLDDALWVHPDIAAQEPALEELAWAGLPDPPVALVAAGAEMGTTDADIARRAWDLPAMDHAYADFLARFRHAGAERRPPPEQALRYLVHMTLEWPYLMMRDPVLPRELLPRAWRSQDAIDLRGRLRARWAPPSLRWLDAVT